MSEEEDSTVVTMRVVPISQIWKAIGVIVASVAVAFTGHGMFVAPAIVAASKDATMELIREHRADLHPGAARDVNAMKAEITSMSVSIQTLLVEQVKLTTQLESLREAIIDLRKK